MEVKDSNHVILERGDRVMTLNEGSFDYGRNAIVVKLIDEETVIISTDNDPTALQNESAFLLLKLKGPGYRNDYIEEKGFLKSLLLENSEKDKAIKKLNIKVVELLDVLSVASNISHLATDLKKINDEIDSKSLEPKA